MFKFTEEGIWRPDEKYGWTDSQIMIDKFDSLTNDSLIFMIIK